MNFVKTAYLPVKKTVLAVAAIDRSDIEIIEPYRLTALPESLQTHADLSFCYLGNGVAVCAKEAYDYYKARLTGCGIEIVKGASVLDRHYPFDAAYNVAIVGDVIFCKKSITDRVLIATSEELGYRIVDMNQGYGKCSVCPVDAKSAVSADMSFYKAATREGINVLEISNDGIRLAGYENGFFGGAVYMQDCITLCVNGDARLLPDYDKIKKFVHEKGIKIKSEEGPVWDFGSFIPICEE